MKSSGQILTFVCFLLSSFQISLAEQAQRHSLKPCPDKPNCVSSQAPDDDHFIAPWSMPEGLNVDESKEKIIRVISSDPKAKIVEIGLYYLRAEFRSSIFKFTDDVEFLLDEGERTIHIRSASRKGYFDFGVNRKRLNKLYALFSK